MHKTSAKLPSHHQ